MYIEHVISRILAYIAVHGIKNPLPGNNIDIHTVTRGISFLETDFFDEGSHWSYPFDLTAPKYCALKGTLLQRWGQIIFVPADTAHDHIYLRNDCRYEYDDIKKAYRSGQEVVLMLSDSDDPRKADQFILTPKTFAMGDCLPSYYDKWFFMKEFLTLEEKEKNALIMFLTSPSVAKSFFLYASYLASFVVKSEYHFDDGDLLETIDRFEATTLVRFQTSNLIHCNIDTLIKLSGFRHKEEDWYRHLALCAIVGGWSVWSNMPRVQALLASKLGYAHNLDAHLSLICQTHDLNAMAKQLTTDSVYSTDPEQCDNILMHILRANVSLDEKIIPHITQRIFGGKTFELEDLRKFSPIRSTVNWENLIDDLMLKLSTSLAHGVTEYAQSLALVWICEIGAQRDIIVCDAQEMILDKEPATALVGALMLSMQLEYDLRHHISKDPFVLENEGTIVSQLLEWLKHPESIHWNSAAILYRDMAFVCGTDCSPLADPKILEAACKRLDMEARNKIYVSILLSLIPPDHPPDMACFGLFKDDFLQNYTQLLSLDSSENTVAQFRTCLTLGCWDRCNVLTAYSELVEWADRYNAFLQPIDHAYMRKLKTDILTLMVEPISPALEFVPIIPSDDFPQLSSKTITSREEAVSVIRYVQAHCMDSDFDWHELRQQMKSISFEISNAGSFLITQFFYILCFLGLEQEACSFYGRYKNILNHPYQFFPDTEKAFLRPYHTMNRFLNGTQSRVTVGLRLAILSGNYALVWGLLMQPSFSQKLRQEYFPVVDQLLCGMQTETRRIARKAFLLDLNIYNLWLYYYDDPSITASILENHPEYHKSVLSFGYGGIKHFASIAVSKEAESLLYVFPELLRDDEVCLAAMHNPSQVLHLMHAPITYNRHLIAQLLEDEKELCTPSLIHSSFLNDREYGIQAMMRWPLEFHLLSRQLRYDKAVLMAAISSTQSGYAVQHILKHTDPFYLMDHEVITTALALHPELSDLAEKVFPNDPVLTALAARQDYITHVRQKNMAWEDQHFLGLEI